MAAKLTFADLEPVGPGTPTGRYLRRYWQPVMRAKELQPKQAKPIEILGEKFTLYRGESGDAHVVEYRCAHRACPLSLGWVEGDSIRCRYHGWRYESSGQCVEQPAEEKSFAHRITIRTYPTREYVGLIFTYLGEGEPPPFRLYPDLDRPGVIVTDPVEMLPCSFWNRFDNDHSHIPWVHRATAIRRNRPDLLVVRHETVEETQYGWMGTRSVKGGSKADEAKVLGFGRLTHFFMPNVRLFWAPSRAKGFDARGLWDTKAVWVVPINDTSHAAFDVTHTPLEGEEGKAYAASRVQQQEKEAEDRWDLAEKVLAGEMTLEDLPDDMGAYTSFAIEDYATQVGQGPVAGRPREHLAGSDERLVLLRKLWLRDVNALVEGQKLTDWSIPKEPLAIKAAAANKAAAEAVP